VTPKKYVYRGVHAKHPMRAVALKRMVVPGDPNGTITPEEHNLLDASIASPYTSWTHSKTIAQRFANSRRSGGVLLRLPFHPPTQGDTWSWQQSPDVHNDQEILLRGVRMEAEVVTDD